MATGYSSIPSLGLTEKKKDLQFKILENLNETNETIAEDISQRIFNNDAPLLQKVSPGLQHILLFVSGHFLLKMPPPPSVEVILVVILISPYSILGKFHTTFGTILMFYIEPVVVITRDGGNNGCGSQTI